MAVHRTKKVQQQYQAYLASANPGVCAFCAIHENDGQLVRQTKHFNVIKNRFPYAIWDGQEVTEHLMITPKRHIDSLATMSRSEKAEYVDLVESYEKYGYDIYARAPRSIMKSVAHQHTHLIGLSGKPKHVTVAAQKPYLLITF